MKGVTGGDIGPKIGFNNKNNGWTQFNNVRIPRENLLMRFVSVDKQGHFSLQGDMRLMYSSMTGTRTTFLVASGMSLYKGCLIALRYSAVRRQFKNTTGLNQETKLLDYQTQQMKLFPLFGISIAFLFTHTIVLDRFVQMLQDVKRGDFSDMEIIHHLTSGMKTLFTQICYDGLQVVR